MPPVTRGFDPTLRGELPISHPFQQPGTTPIGDPSSQSTLYLVNETVVLRRQALRLVIDAERPVATPAAIAPDAARLPDRNSGRAPALTDGPRRLTAARVGTSPVPGFVHPGSSRTAPSPSGDVRREMLAASCLSQDDARLILARRAAEAIEGGAIARLAPARRRGLERLATKLGLRAFDTNLVIAIAQDAARSSDPIDSTSVCGRLNLVGGPTRRAVMPARATIWTLLAAATIAAALVAALSNWIVAG